MEQGAVISASPGHSRGRLLRILGVAFGLAITVGATVLLQRLV